MTEKRQLSPSGGGGGSGEGGKCKKKIRDRTTIEFKNGKNKKFSYMTEMGCGGREKTADGSIRGDLNHQGGKGWNRIFQGKGAGLHSIQWTVRDKRQERRDRNKTKGLEVTILDPIWGKML